MIIINTPTVTLDSKKKYVESCVKIMSMTRYLTGKADRPITDRQATIIALYIIYGSFYETKVGKRIKVDQKLRRKVSKILNFESRSIDSHNLKLRLCGYIEKDDYTTDIKRLSSLFTPLKEELDKMEGNVEIATTFSLELMITYDVSQ